MQLRRVTALRFLAVAAVAVAGMSTSGAQAATKPKPKPIKPVCNLLTDPAGDAKLIAQGSSDDAMDILSADVATSAKTITVVLRLKAWSDTDSTAPIGRDFYVIFTAPGDANPIYLDYSKSVTGDSYSWGEFVTTAGQGSYNSVTGVVTGSVNANAATITMSVPVATVAAKAAITPGTKLTNLSAETSTLVGAPANPSGITGGVVFQVDTASGGKTYTAGTPSCVKPTP